MMFQSTNAPQSVHKRSHMGVYHLFSIDDAPSLIQCSDEQNDFPTPQLLDDIDKTDAFIPSAQGRMNTVGLVRSHSFPPEGWHKTTSKYILKVSPTSMKTKFNDELLTGKDIKHEDCVCSKTPITTSELVDVSHEQNSPTELETVKEQEQFNVVNAAYKQTCDSPLVPKLTSSSNQSSANICNVASDEGETPTITDEAEDNIKIRSLSLMPTLSVTPSTVVQPGLVVSEPTAVEAGYSIPASTIPPSGKVLVCGRRREMEDAASIVPSFLSVPYATQLADEPDNKTVQEWHFFGVFDGHGGSQASVYCVDRLHHLVAEEYMKVFGSKDINKQIGDDFNLDLTKVMKAAFSKMDKEVGGVCPNAVLDRDDDVLDGGCLCCEDAIAPENVGTTAVVALVGVNQIVVANCGDSRALLARGGHAIPLSRDHKPELEDETNRIEAAGGRVICWDGFRVGGLLALSRAIGDRYLKRYVISEPDVKCVQRMEDDECLILASDGLWDVLGNEFACDVARRSLAALRKKYELRSFPPGEDAAAAAVAALLVKLAYGRGSQDNISVVVVDLKSRKSS